ncbi:hypothetical protein P3521_03570 [Vibrio parahaemolyticus]|nr:hypothetical protein [Vibrio parahaemolyticus]MDF4668680.1 hypothetical protein [Vibrio parahaemolyticus]HAV1412770.1 hypothetical protein [Vibrio parahaemolyticus]HAV2004854.1 hypothetical protein [Vibrio parahaemolyticus]
MSEPVEKENVITFFYMGERLNGDQLVAVVCPIVDGHPQPSKRTLFKKARSKGRLSTGWIHTTSGDLNPDSGEIESISLSSSIPVRPYQQNGLDQEMRLLERSAQTEVAMFKKAKEHTLNNQIDELVKPIRKAMNRTNHAGRSAILAMVIERLTK